MQALLESLLKALVSKPEAVVVTVENAEDSRVYKVLVDQEDLGRVIGKNGRVVGALRRIFRAGTAREGKTVWIEVTAEGAAPPAAAEPVTNE